MKDNVMNTAMIYITMWQQVDMKNNKMCFSTWLQLIMRITRTVSAGAMWAQTVQCNGVHLHQYPI